MKITWKTPFYALRAFFIACWWRIRGFQSLAPGDVTESRLEECEACEELLVTRQCNVCTCYVDAKTALASERCPKGRWERFALPKR